MKNNTNQFPLKKMAEVMKVSRSGYYAYLRRETSLRKKENIKLMHEIESIYEEHRGLYGSPRIHAVLKHHGWTCSRKRAAKLMQKAGLRAKTNKNFQKRKKFIERAACNLLKQNFTVDHPDRIWASDITYIKTGEGWIYLAATLDLFSRKVIGWAIEDHMRIELVEKALKQALFRRKPELGLIHHSDRGAQYTSNHFKKICDNESIILSMNSGSCFDNAAVESFFHTVKTELIYLKKFKTKQEAKRALFEYIEGFYNRKRLHSTLGYLSPEVFESKYSKQQILCS
jgi:putative transposase